MPKNQRYRKRKTHASNSDGDEPASVSERLADTRLLQKKRLKASGVDAAVLGMAEKTNQHGAGTDSEGTDEDDGPEILDAYVKAKSLRSTGESKHMDQYVELEMAKRLGKDDASQPAIAGANSGQLDDELYEIPDSLKSGGTPNVTIPGLMTGITEVQLPIDVRLKNIEDTEAAKKLLLEATGGKCPSAVEDSKEEPPLTYKEIFEPKRSMFAPLFGSNRKHSVNVKGPTDDIVAKRFIRGEKSRRRR